MYVRNLTSALAALPYQHKGVATPEMSRQRLIFAVCYGAVFWVVRELPLWMCWAFFLALSFGAFLTDQAIPSTPFLVAYVGVPIVYLWLFTAVFTLTLTVIRTGLLILRSKWAIGISLLIALIVTYALY